MTIIVAVKGQDQVVLASDTQMSVGGIVEYGISKFYRKGHTAIGSSGEIAMNSLISYYMKRESSVAFCSVEEVQAFFFSFGKFLKDTKWLVNDVVENNAQSPFRDLNTWFLIACQAGIFRCDHTGAVTEHPNFWAIGSGERYALGSLYQSGKSSAHDSVLNRACAAVEAANQFDPYYGGAVDTTFIPLEKS